MKIGDLLEVIRLDGIGINLEDLLGFIVLKLEHSLEGEHGLGLVEDMKDDDVVTGKPKAMQGSQHRCGVRQEVAENHDQAAMPHHAGDLMQARFDVGFAGRLELGEQREDIAKLRPLAPRRQALADLLIEGDQADRVLLVDHQIAERGRKTDAVLEFGELLTIGVTHRSRQIHHQVAGQVRFRLELLDVEAVGLGVNVPVHVGNIVAGRVLAMFGELDRKPLERAGVQPRDEALNNELGAEVEPRHLADDGRVQVFFGGRH